MTERQPGHGSPVLPTAQVSGFVPSLSSGYHNQFVQMKLSDGNFGHGDMGNVRRIKCAAQNADALLCQTQSLGFKN
jgi:hypothetical protein